MATCDSYIDAAMLVKNSSQCKIASYYLLEGNLSFK